MVFDEVNALRPGQRDSGCFQAAREARDLDGILHARRRASPVAGPGQDTTHLRPEMRPRVARDGYAVHAGDAVPTQTGTRGERWKSGPVLDPVQPLFLNRKR